LQNHKNSLGYKIARNKIFYGELRNIFEIKYSEIQENNNNNLDLISTFTLIYLIIDA